MRRWDFVLLQGTLRQRTEELSFVPHPLGEPFLPRTLVLPKPTHLPSGYAGKLDCRDEERSLLPLPRGKRERPDHVWEEGGVVVRSEERFGWTGRRNDLGKIV